MPLATSANVLASLSSGRLCTADDFHQGKIHSRASPSQLQKAAAMRDVKHAATEMHVDSFAKLPSRRVLELLSKYIEPADAAAKQSDNSSACVAMTVAVAEFKGPEVHGVVRFAQVSSGQQECSVEAVIDGLAPGAHGWSVHEYGDLTRGPFSTGATYPSGTPEHEQLGNLGSLLVDSDGHAQCSASHDKLVVRDIIGRSVVLYGVAEAGNVTRVAAAVIARSARPSRLNPQLCNCDGSLLWQGNANT